MSKRQWVKLSIVLVVAVIGLIVMFQNIESVSFAFLFWKPRIPLVLLLLVALLAGFALGWFVSFLLRRKEGQQVE